jgi:tRNA U54 and U55 pseudouridine synthase Pus10
LSLTEPHNEFLELCAVSTSGQLTEDEQKRLQEHLVVCESCREILKQYETVVDRAIPAVAANETSGYAAQVEPDSSWSEDEAERAFFKRLERGQRVVDRPEEPR